MDKKMWCVSFSAGDYSDHYTYIVAVHENEDDANEHAYNANAWLLNNAKGVRFVGRSPWDTVPVDCYVGYEYDSAGKYTVFSVPLGWELPPQVSTHQHSLIAQADGGQGVTATELPSAKGKSTVVSMPPGGRVSNAWVK
jgi:hypothetical protein